MNFLPRFLRRPTGWRPAGESRRAAASGLRRMIFPVTSTISGLLVLSVSLAQQTPAGPSPAAGPAAPSPTPAGSKTSDPMALASLRKRYQLLLASAGKPSMDRWVAALEALEKQRIASGDFDGAARARGKISALQGKGGAGSGGRAAPATTASLTASARIPILLRPGAARTSPGVEFTGTGRQTLRFKKTGASLEWDLTNAQPGAYEVRLTYGSFGPADESGAADPRSTPQAVPVPAQGTPPDQSQPAFQQSGDRAGGAVEFRRISSLGTGSVMLRRTIHPTSGWAAYRTISLGTMALDSRIAKFSLRAVECQSMGLMDFRTLELVPADASAGTGTGADSPPAVTAGPVPEPGSSAYPKELTRLKEVYQKSFIEQTRAANAKYFKNLTDLEAQIALTKDTDTLALLRQEKKLVERGGDRTVQPAITFDLPVNDSLVATIRGEARLTSQKDYLIRLRPAGGCEIIWKLTRLGIPPGDYDVRMDYRTSAEGGGSATLFAQTGGGSGPPSGALNLLIPNSGNPGDQQTIAPGRVSIAKGADHLFLRVTGLSNSDGSLCDLKRLHLTPVSTP